MTLESIIELASARGPWEIKEKDCGLSAIRNDLDECPIHAAALAYGASHSEVTGGFTGSQFLNLSREVRDCIIIAADREGSRHYPEIRKALIAGLITH